MKKYILIILASVLSSLIPLFLIFLVTITPGYYSAHISESEIINKFILFVDDIIGYLYLYFPFIFPAIFILKLLRPFNLQKFYLLFVTSQTIAFIINHFMDPEDHLFIDFITVTVIVVIAVPLAQKLLKYHKATTSRCWENHNRIKK